MTSRDNQSVTGHPTSEAQAARAGGRTTVGLNRRPLLGLVLALSAVLGIAGAAAAGAASLGWKKCSQCSCEKYDASGNICRCGHGFYQHYN